MLDRIVKNVDVLVGNEEDLQLGLGIPAPSVEAKSKVDSAAFESMMDNVIKKHPHVKVVATTLRHVHSTNRHTWSAVAWIDGKVYNAPTAELDVHRPHRRRRRLRRRLLLRPAQRRGAEEAVKLGWAHGALLTTFPGDTTMATTDQVRAFAKGGSARVQR